jgi:hypothetical protein
MNDRMKNARDAGIDKDCEVECRVFGKAELLQVIGLSAYQFEKVF